jgi:hypothetical protein
MGILADSTDCATFVYLKSNCVQTPTIKCGGARVSWDHTVPRLKTAVVCKTVKNRWNVKELELDHDHVYYFKRWAPLWKPRWKR